MRLKVILEIDIGLFKRNHVFFGMASGSEESAVAVAQPWLNLSQLLSALALSQSSHSGVEAACLASGSAVEWLISGLAPVGSGLGSRSSLEVAYLALRSVSVSFIN